jgi:hypothetical protein
LKEKRSERPDIFADKCLNFVYKACEGLFIDALKRSFVKILHAGEILAGEGRIFGVELSQSFPCFSFQGCCV